ncbi:MAG TPA: multiheme c-type cytochrome [Kofleriaceae bacterium]|nr:multiheme c-type cytochrome [Kofleriaceae bacterium]
MPRGSRVPGALRVLMVSGCCALSLACGRVDGKREVPPPAPGEKVVLFVTTELKGTIEPCGCNSDPMGDIARTAALVEEARRGGAAVLVLDGGSLLYSQTRIAPESAEQERLKADLVVDFYGKTLEAAAIGLGPYDLSMGAQAVRPPRQAANLPAAAGVATRPPEIVQAGKVVVGVFGVVSPDALAPAGIRAGDPVAAARDATADLRRRGAGVVVALAHMTRKDARDLARKVSGIDFVVVGQNAPGSPAKLVEAPEAAGTAWLVQPADRGQVVSRIDIAVRGSGARMVDAIGEERAKVESADLEARAADLRAELAKWKSDPSADRAFVGEKQKELSELEAERARLAAHPLQIPEQGSWFTLSQVRVRRRLACDRAVVARKTELDRVTGRANLAAAEKRGPPPAPAAGAAHYVGDEECEGCHQAAVAFWKQTVHARAWDILKEVGKEASYDCVSCHVTGWGEPGGSNLAHNQPLRAVQCEVCHGPGSLHVDANGKEKKSSLVRRTPEERCKGCHNEDHSDTFQYQAYLRDVLGPGHGQAMRAELGDGPTGHQLRSAALAKAGRDVGAGCPK